VFCCCDTLSISSIDKSTSGLALLMPVDLLIVNRELRKTHSNKRHMCINKGCLMKAFFIYKNHILNIRYYNESQTVLQQITNKKQIFKNNSKLIITKYN